MATIARFEDLIAWQKAKALVVPIYKLTQQTEFAKDFGLKDQCRRAAVSVVSNIAEGFERKGNREFLQFLFIALGSLGELQTQIEIAFDLQYITKEDLENSKVKIIEVRKIVSGLVSHLKSTEFKGTKFNYS